MKILLAHNFYQQPDGEHTVYCAERELLAAMGHRVVEYTRHNDEIVPNGMLSCCRLAAGTIWSRESYRALLELLKREKPDVAHFHNTLPLISPSAYYACREAGVPVVQTLHNYRLFCPAATFYRGGAICEECVEHGILRGLRYSCYRGSGKATAAVAAMLAVHHALGTYYDNVDVYIALGEFARRKLIEAGLPAEKIMVKPNFVHPDPGPVGSAGLWALYVGRFRREKGVRTMLTAWKRLGGRVPLEVIGDGPERTVMEAAVDGLEGIHFLGRLPHERVLSALKQARLLVFPSEMYETFGLVAVEAFACGLPVIASRLGAMEEIVADGRTGLHFTPGDADDLAAKVEWAWAHPREMAEMGRAARAEYEARYTAERNYEMLMEIYRQAIAYRRRGAKAHDTSSV